MKKLAIVVLFVAAACHRRAPAIAPNGAAPGAATARGALQSFMTAAKAQDLQALANVWGTSSGPILSSIDRAEVEKREIIVLCYLKHDSYTIIAEIPGEKGERIFTVEDAFRDLKRTANFWVTPGPDSRWYVRAFDSNALADICVQR